ncbi:MAG: hypothetical protein HYZ42_00820 [Bacteroidetes bacterium]|nr:hypothetical protein [Bacteroidota bacterium]
MNRLIIIILLNSFLFAYTELHEVIKLPSLIGHYFEHQKEDSQVSFNDFLALHYSDNKHQSANHQHEKLPFKTELTLSVVFFDLRNEESSVVLSPLVVAEDHLFLDFESPIYSLNACSGIWQPPKIS